MPGRPLRYGLGAPRHLAAAGAAMALPLADEPAQRAAEPSSLTPPQLRTTRPGFPPSAATAATDTYSLIGTSASDAVVPWPAASERAGPAHDPGKTPPARQ